MRRRTDRPYFEFIIVYRQRLLFIFIITEAVYDVAKQSDIFVSNANNAHADAARRASGRMTDDGDKNARFRPWRLGWWGEGASVGR